MVIAKNITFSISVGAQGCFNVSCQASQFSCDSYRCIPADYRCDGEVRWLNDRLLSLSVDFLVVRNVTFLFTVDRRTVRTGVTSQAALQAVRMVPISVKVRPAKFL